MNETYKRIDSTNGFAYLFQSENEISVFFSESFNIELIKKNIDNKIYLIIKELLINEEILANNIINLHENGYLYNFMKIVDGTIVKIGVIPKIINLLNSLPIEKDDLRKINTILLNLDNLLKSYRKNIKKTKIFKKSDGCFNMLEFETDLLILKNILYDISNNNIVFPIESKRVFSNSLIGDVNIEACREVRELNILPQYFNTKKKNYLKAVIYSAIFSKYNTKLIEFLRLNKQNKTINDLLYVVINLQNNPFFEQKELTYTIPQIKSLIIQNRNNLLFQQNQKIMSNLSILLDNNINIDEKLNFKKKVIRLEKIWEQFNEQFFSERFKDVSFQGVKNISSNNKNQIYFSDTDSKIDIIWKEWANINGKEHFYYNIADCKYKVLSSNGEPKIEDVDKLIRDSLIHNALSYREKNGELSLNEKIILEKSIFSYLIYPKNIVIDVSTWNNKALVLNNNVDYYSNSKQLDFSKNLEYKDKNVITLNVDFLLAINQ